MATENADDETVTIPSTDEYRKETREVRMVHLPTGGFDLPMFHTSPGRIMAVVESYELTGFFDSAEGADVEDMVDDEGSISLNRFMVNEVVPNVAVERTNKDAVHWNDQEIANDPDVDDLDLSELKEDDMYAMVTGMMGVEDAGEELQRFPG